MDLERCPKCGNRWVAGYEKCMECGFVPIGAGLKNAPARKKKRRGKYVEPGSSRGLLGIVLLGLLGFGAYRYKPWEDDWEMLRAMLGQGRRHSVVGDWEITKALVLKKDKPAVLTSAKVRSGTINFAKDGSVKLVLDGRESRAVSKGRYVVSGQTVAMNALKTDAAEFGVPSTLKMQLSWSGPDEVLASVGSEVLYMRRMDKKAALVNIMKVSLTKGATTTKGDGNMRGMVTQMEGQLKEIDGG